jgi:glutamyl-tRNA reductase
MPTIVVQPELYKRVEEAAQAQHSNPEAILTEAIQHYFWELDRRKISEETRRYRQQHNELKAQYLGQYIAMHDGQVIDHDGDFTVLRQRVRQQFGRMPVMITLVEAVPAPPLTRKSFTLQNAPHEISL